MLRVRKKWTAWAGTVYLCALCLVLLPAVPLLPAGGYTAITQLKFRLYAALTGLWLLGECCFGRRRKYPAALAVCVGGWLLWSLFSACCSPWRKTAFFGSERCEGMLTLLCYGLSCIRLSGTRVRKRPVMTCFLMGILLLDAVSILQLLGKNPLGLYPPGMSWYDANLRYSGAYLGTVGNAGLTGAVLAAACSLFFLLIVQRGGGFRLLILPMLPTGWVLGRSCMDGPLLGLLAVLVLAFPVLVRDSRALGRYLYTAALLLTVLLLPELKGEAMLLLLLAAAGMALEAGKRRPLGRLPLALTILAVTAAVLTIYGYTGWRSTLREASALLHGQVSPDFGSGRIYIWQRVWEQVSGHPWLGTGPDTLGLWELAPYEWYAQEAGIQVYTRIDAAHNEYLQTLACQGIPAALLHLSLPLLALRRFGKCGSAAAGTALCYGIFALTGISACAAAPLFWVLLALGERDHRDFLEDKYDPDR